MGSNLLPKEEHEVKPSLDFSAIVAAMVVGFSVVVLMFRIQRELDMQDRDEATWIAYADRLVIAATVVAGILSLVLPSLGFDLRGVLARIPPAASACATVLLLGYVFAILAHYRLILGRDRKGPRDNPEPAERWICLTSTCLGIAVFFVSMKA
jgi:peptidoglycan biosynthesis protein MviN/MurJ (putative lipid II flippase)